MTRQVGTRSTTRHIAQALLLLTSAAFLVSLQGCNPTPKAMDIIWSADLVDHNGLASNPIWRMQSTTGQPADVCSVCPCSNTDGAAWTAAANCTNVSVETTSSWLCFGHWNWFPVEYDGTLTWAGHSNSIYDDDDYYMYIQRADQALQTSGTRQGIELEFDSEETVDNWDNTNTWWDDFHHNYVDNSDSAAHSRIDGLSAILVGLAGIDQKHTAHTELHPVYAMFVHVEDTQTQDKWAFFVRNWGNEGFCASDQQNAYFPGRQLKVLLPHVVSPGFGETDNVWVYGDNSDDYDKEGWGMQTTSEGLLLTFGLQDPSKKDGFVGDITINWGNASTSGQTAVGGKTPTKAGSPSVSVSGRSKNDDDDEKGEDAALKAKFDQLDPVAQKLLVKQLKSMTLHPPARLKRGTLITTTAPKRIKPSSNIPNDGNLIKSVHDDAGEARKAKRREATLAFLKAHGVQ